MIRTSFLPISNTVTFRSWTGIVLATFHLQILYIRLRRRAALLFWGIAATSLDLVQRIPPHNIKHYPVLDPFRLYQITFRNHDAGRRSTGRRPVTRVPRLGVCVLWASIRCCHSGVGMNWCWDSIILPWPSPTTLQVELKTMNEVDKLVSWGCSHQRATGPRPRIKIDALRFTITPVVQGSVGNSVTSTGWSGDNAYSQLIVEGVFFERAWWVLSCDAVPRGDSPGGIEPEDGAHCLSSLGSCSCCRCPLGASL